MFKNMQQREKVLLFLFLGVAVVWFGEPIFTGMFITPVKKRNADLVDMQDRKQLKEFEHLQFVVSKNNLEDWKKISLPPNTTAAQRLYKDWLEDLAKLSGITPTAVTPGARPSSKSKVYSTVPVTMQGEATFSKLCTFLYHFHSANLMHRIYSLKVNSSANEGDPPMRFTLIAEGISLTGVPERTRLFQETTLVGAISADSHEIEVASVTGFPRPLKTIKPFPKFRIRVGMEYLTVTGISGTQWTVERADDSASRLEHPSGSTVQLARVNRKMKEKSFEDYRKTLIAQSPFLLPVIYDPKIAPLGEIIVVRGEPLKRKIEISGFDPVKGKTVFQLKDNDKVGLKIDPATGEMVWEPSKDQKTGKFPASVSVTQTEEAEDGLSQEFFVSLVEPNTPPVLESIGKQTVFAGETMKFTAKSTDADEPKNTLTFSLGAGLPTGATINAQSGEFQWTPSAETEARDHVVEVIVSDNGTPAKTTSEKVTIAVIDDTARFTRFVGSIVRGGEPEAWLYDRSNNKKMVLKEGAPFKLANIDAFVLTIGRNFVLMQIDGKTWRLELGEDLRAMKELQEEQQQTSAQPVPLTATAKTSQ